MRPPPRSAGTAECALLWEAYHLWSQQSNRGGRRRIHLHSDAAWLRDGGQSAARLTSRLANHRGAATTFVDFGLTRRWCADDACTQSCRGVLLDWGGCRRRGISGISGLPSGCLAFRHGRLRHDFRSSCVVPSLMFQHFDLDHTIMSSAPLPPWPDPWSTCSQDGDDEGATDELLLPKALN